MKQGTRNRLFIQHDVLLQGNKIMNWNWVAIFDIINTWEQNQNLSTINSFTLILYLQMSFVAGISYFGEIARGSEVNIDGYVITSDHISIKLNQSMVVDWSSSYEWVLTHWTPGDVAIISKV